MTQEEKQLLLIDLCARLPYGIKFPYHMEGDCNHRECDCVATIDSISEDDVEFTYEDNCYSRDWSCPLSYVKPYLRPMSSMTEEEKEEFREVIELELKALEGGSGLNVANAAPAAFEIDFYNAHHFDFRNLIGKGLAIDCTNLDIY